MGLETLAPEKLNVALEEKGVHDRIENAPWEAEFPDRPKVSFDMAASDSHLFVKFNVEGSGLKAEFGRTNDPVWQDSCVEIFIGDADGKGYCNFEVNCIGALLSAHQERKEVNVTPITEEDARRIIRYASAGSEPFAEKEGEHRWTLTIGVPWDYLGYDGPPESLRANLYKCADGSRRPHYLCWAPIETPTPNFHCPEYFGKLEFHG